MTRPKNLKPLSLYWWQRDSGTKNNFGDEMSPLLLEYATGRPVHYADPRDADVVGVGSILQLFSGKKKKALKMLGHRAISRRRLRPVVWGSGTTGMDASGSVELAELVSWHLDVRAVRGPATKRKLGASLDIFGDPALLSSKVWPASAAKTHRVGIVPHYLDMDTPALKRLTERFPEAKIISVENEVHQVVGEIASCEQIFSSSLHGLIVADSFEIPNYRLVLEGHLTGGDFKFKDYADGIGRPDITPVTFADDERVLEGDFDYQKGLDGIAETLIKSIGDLSL